MGIGGHAPCACHTPFGTSPQKLSQRFRDPRTVNHGSRMTGISQPPCHSLYAPPRLKLPSLQPSGALPCSRRTSKPQACPHLRTLGIPGRVRPSRADTTSCGTGHPSRRLELDAPHPRQASTLRKTSRPGSTLPILRVSLALSAATSHFLLRPGPGPNGSGRELPTPGIPEGKDHTGAQSPRGERPGESLSRRKTCIPPPSRNPSPAGSVSG